MEKTHNKKNIKKINKKQTKTNNQLQNKPTNNIAIYNKTKTQNIQNTKYNGKSLNQNIVNKIPNTMQNRMLK